MHIFQHELKKTHIYSNILQFPLPFKCKKKTRLRFSKYRSRVHWQGKR